MVVSTTACERSGGSGTADDGLRGSGVLRCRQVSAEKRASGYDGGEDPWSFHRNFVCSGFCKMSLPNESIQNGREERSGQKLVPRKKQFAYENLNQGFVWSRLGSLRNRPVNPDIARKPSIYGV